MKGLIQKKYVCPVVLILLLVCQLIYTTCVFADRQVFHSDEIWSYGLANSYYKPFIYGEDGIFIEKITVDEYTYANEWVSAEIFNKYITVQEGEQFAYDSVYHNQSLDHHPPLYYALLHTICSFFPNRFSLWYGFFLSGIFLMVTQIFLYKLTEKVTGSSLVALLTCVLYGAGNGAVLTFTFIRQYSLLTMLCVMYTYFGACLYQDYRSEQVHRRHLLGMIATAFCAFMTHYYAIIYIGMFTACFCLWLLLRRQWKKMLQLGLSMAGTLGIFFLFYPAALSQTFEGNARKVTGLPFMVQYRCFLNQIFQYNLGFHIDIWGTMFFKLVWPCVIFCMVCLMLLYIPFRKETWMQRILTWLRRLPVRFFSWLRKLDYFPFFVLTGVLMQCVAVNITVSVMKMGVYSMRYVFMDFPLACLVFVVFVRWILRVILDRKYPKLLMPTLLMIVCVVVVSVKMQTLPKFDSIKPGKPQDMAECFRDKNCIFILKNSGDYWLTTNASMYLRFADKVYLTWGDRFEEERNDNIIDECETDYIIIYADFLELNEHEQQMVDKWLQGESSVYGEEQNNMEVKKEETEKTLLNNKIRSLNGGCQYDLAGVLCFNGELLYVLELKKVLP